MEGLAASVQGAASVRHGRDKGVGRFTHTVQAVRQGQTLDANALGDQGVDAFENLRLTTEGLGRVGHVHDSQKRLQGGNGVQRLQTEIPAARPLQDQNVRDGPGIVQGVDLWAKDEFSAGGVGRPLGLAP